MKLFNFDDWTPAERHTRNPGTIAVSLVLLVWMIGLSLSDYLAGEDSRP